MSKYLFLVYKFTLSIIIVFIVIIDTFQFISLYHLILGFLFFPPFLPEKSHPYFFLYWRPSLLDYFLTIWNTCFRIFFYLKTILLRYNWHTNCIHIHVLRHFSHVQLCVTLWTVTYQAPLSMGFSRQEYLSGLPFPSPGDLPDPGFEPGYSALRADFFTVWATKEAPKWNKPDTKYNYCMILFIWGINKYLEISP